MAVAEPMSLSPPTPRKKKKCTDTEAEKYTSKFQVNTHLSFLVFFFFFCWLNAWFDSYIDSVKRQLLVFPESLTLHETRSNKNQILEIKISSIQIE